MNMNTFDVVIIGNGVLGMSTALALTLEDPNLKIAVVGPVTRNGSATLAAGAVLNCFSEITKFNLTSKYFLSKFEIARKALKAWPNWLAQINSMVSKEEQLTVNPGTFMILNTRSGVREDDNYFAIREALDNYQEPYEDVTSTEIPGLDPVEDSRPLRAMYLPNEGAINPIKLLIALERACIKNGKVTLINDRVSKILLKENKVVGVSTLKGLRLKSERILLAAGAYSAHLIEQIPSLSRRIPKLLSGMGCSLILQANHKFKNIIRSPVRAGSCGICILPYENNSNMLFMGSSTSVIPLPTSNAKARDVYYLLERAIDQFDHKLHNAEIIRYQVGNRPFVIDTFPLIGGSASIAGLWILTGTYRDGINDSSILATSIAKEILGKKTIISHEFIPERLPISWLNKEQAIKEFAEQYLSVGYEHNMKLPKLAWESAIKEMAVKRIENIYEKLDIDIGLSPDLLFMFEYIPETIPIFKQYFKTIKQELSKRTGTYTI